MEGTCPKLGGRLLILLSETSIVIKCAFSPMPSVDVGLFASCVSCWHSASASGHTSMLLVGTHALPVPGIA
eukprot:3586843-Rhodomonas_salina.4